MCAKRRHEDEAVVRPRRRQRPGRPDPGLMTAINGIGLVLLLVSGLCMFGSLIMPWGSLDVETKIGIIPVTLDADVYEYGVKYEADLSGTEGLISSNQNMSGKMKEERVFITGLGKFQETIGFVKGSSKYRNHTIELYTTIGENEAPMVIETAVSQIPWWPVGLPQDVSLTIKFDEAPRNITHVEVKEVWFEMHRVVDGKDLYKVLWEQTPGDKLKKMGDSVTYNTKLTVDEDFGKFSIVGRAKLEMIDKDGESNNGRELRSFSGNPKMIGLWTVSNEKTVRIGMLLVAAPITVLSGVILIITAIASFFRKHWAWKLAVVGAMVALISILFFIAGVYALIELTGYGDWFAWNYAGLIPPITGTVLGYAAVAPLFISAPPRPCKKGKGAKRKKKLLLEDEEEAVTPVKKKGRKRASKGKKGKKGKKVKGRKKTT
jgi:hypothetical protein